MTHPPTDTRTALLDRLHHAPLLPESWRVFWTPNGDEDRKLSYWLRGGGSFAPPAAWQQTNVYFGVNPSAIRREVYESSTNDTIGAVNAFLSEFDGKDFVTESEWLPHYVAPDVGGLTPGKTRGALQKAQTAANDATFKLDPDLYKARAMAHIVALPEQPTALWDSGGGYQGVWLLDDTVYLYGPDGARDLAQYERMRTLQHKWTAYVGGDPSASDLRRVLRWPGSINFKQKYAPNYPTVDLLYCNLERTYQLSVLEELLPKDPPRATQRRVHVPAGLPVDLGAVGDVPDLPRHPAIAELNRRTDLRTLLLGFGYTAATDGRLSRPGGDSGGVDLHPDNTATIFSSSDPLYCGHRITAAHAIVVYEFGGDLDAFLATFPDFRATVERLAALQDQLKQHGRWLASPEAIMELKAAGFKNPERARKLLDTILEKCEGKKTLRIKPGYACLSKESGISKGGIGGYLARLFTGGFINLHTGEEGEPTGIELVLRNLNTSSLLVDGGGVQVAQNWILYREFRADEVFINGHAAYTATHPNATLAPLGDNGLSALLPLQDGPLTIAEAAEETGHSYGAMARTLRRYAEHGMVDVTVGERNRKTYTLKAEWRDILKINIPKMTTFGVMLFRNVAALGSRVKYLRAKGADDKADAVEKEHARLDALERKVKETAGIIPFVQPDRIDKPQPFKKRAPNVTLPPHVLQRRTDASRPTEADKWRRREYAKDIAAAGYDWAELNAWATLEHGAGWWTHKDKTAIIGQYRIFQIVANQTPTVHWAGEHLVAA